MQRCHLISAYCDYLFKNLCDILAAQPSQDEWVGWRGGRAAERSPCSCKFIQRWRHSTPFPSRSICFTPRNLPIYLGSSHMLHDVFFCLLIGLLTGVPLNQPGHIPHPLPLFQLNQQCSTSVPWYVPIFATPAQCKSRPHINKFKDVSHQSCSSRQVHSTFAFLLLL